MLDTKNVYMKEKKYDLSKVIVIILIMLTKIYSVSELGGLWVPDILASHSEDNKAGMIIHRVIFRHEIGCARELKGWKK